MLVYSLQAVFLMYVSVLRRGTDPLVHITYQIMCLYGAVLLHLTPLWRVTVII